METVLTANPDTESKRGSLSSRSSLVKLFLSFWFIALTALPTEGAWAFCRAGDVMVKLTTI